MNVGVLSVGTAVPDSSFSQEQLLAFVLSRFNIQERTRQLYRKVMSNSSVERRHVAADDLDEVLDKNHDRQNQRFEKRAVALASQALTQALGNARLTPGDLDYVAAATCTGYICPGLSSHLVETVGLKRSVHVADMVGMGCGAAIPALEQACHFAIAHPGKTAAVVCSEVCTAAFFSNDDPDIVVSNALFADGAAAILVRCGASQPGPSIRGFAARTVPEWRDELRFFSDGGHLKNKLGRNVPIQAAQAVRDALSDFPSDRKTAHWILHAGGQKFLDALYSELKLSEHDVACSRSVLRRFGNMSSPTVLFVLDEMMRTRAPSPGDAVVMASFGAGFSAYAALLEWI
jgi:alkylresorcinol/alkylpyrone synthase